MSLPRYESTKFPSSFKENNSSFLVTVIGEATGVKKKHYDKDRWKECGPVAAMYSDSRVSLAHDLINGVEATGRFPPSLPT